MADRPFWTSKTKRLNSSVDSELTEVWLCSQKENSRIWMLAGISTKQMTSDASGNFFSSCVSFAVSLILSFSEMCWFGSISGAAGGAGKGNLMLAVERLNEHFEHAGTDFEVSERHEGHVRWTFGKKDDDKYSLMGRYWQIKKGQTVVCPELYRNKVQISDGDEEEQVLQVHLGEL